MDVSPIFILASKQGYCNNESELEEFVHELCHVTTLGIPLPTSGWDELEDNVVRAVLKLPSKEARDWDEVKALAIEAEIYRHAGKKLDVEQSADKATVRFDKQVVLEQVKFLRSSAKIQEYVGKAVDIARAALEAS